MVFDLLTYSGIKLHSIPTHCENSSPLFGSMHITFSSKKGALDLLPFFLHFFFFLVRHKKEKGYFSLTSFTHLHFSTLPILIILFFRQNSEGVVEGFWGLASHLSMHILNRDVLRALCWT